MTQKRKMWLQVFLMLHVVALAFLFTWHSALAASPPNLTNDIVWDEDSGTAGDQQTFDAVADITNAFNNARRQEESQLGLSNGTLGTLSLPSQATWDTMIDDEKALWLLNAERTARAGQATGVLGLPLAGINPDLDTVAQNYAQHLITVNKFGHAENGSPTDRLDAVFGDPNANPTTACREFMTRAENIAGFWTSGSSIPMVIERSVYGWLYEDASSAWGHREAALLQDTPLSDPTATWGYKNNVGSSAHEGLLGIGRSSASTYNPFNFGGMNFGEVVVMNIVDPSTNPGCPTDPAQPTPTNTSVPPTATPVDTPTNTPVPPTATPVDTPTNTPVPPTATPVDTPTNTPVPPTATPVDTPTNTPVPPTATPIDTPTNTPLPPTATPTNTPVPSTQGIWLSPAEIAALPTSGPAWLQLKAAADAVPGAATLGSQDTDANVNYLAKALVFARTGQTSYRDDVVGAIRIITLNNTEDGGRTLALGRELAAYIIAADLINLKTYDPVLDAQFRTKLRTLLTKPLESLTLQQTHERRPNNWGTHAGASRAAIAVYLGDQTELTRTWLVYRGWVGERAAYSGFSFGDLSWQSNPQAPVSINPVGAVKQGRNIDGAMTEEMRRGGTFQWPPKYTGYAWEGMQGAVVQAHILHRAGYPAWEWQDRALLRATLFLKSIGWAAESDDAWQPWLINTAYGMEVLPAVSPAGPGKNMGWTNWTHPGPWGAVATSTPLPPTATPTNTPLPATATPTDTPVDPTATSTNTPLPATATPTNTLVGPTATSTNTPVAPTSTPTNTPVAPTVTPTPGSQAPLTFAPSADANVNSGSVNSNYGAVTTVRLRGGNSPEYRTYLKFNVTGLTQPVTNAKIRLFVTDPSNSGGSIYQVIDTSWGETTIKWANAPALAATPLQTVGTVSNGVWVEYNVTSAVTGNGLFSFGLKTLSTDSLYYSSKEGAKPPQLVITTGVGAVAAASLDQVAASAVSTADGTARFQVYLPAIGK